jgi:hypothetical protein
MIVIRRHLAAFATRRRPPTAASIDALRLEMS